MSQADIPAQPQPCTTCGGSGQVTITLRNDRTHTDQVIIQTCTDCL
jgi:DnaJ-class molecular chaperone